MPNPERTMQPEQSETMAPSVSQVTEAMERLELSNTVREEAAYEHTYQQRAQDEAVVAQFINEYGALPPRNYIRRLWWWLSGARGEG